MAQSFYYNVTRPQCLCIWFFLLLPAQWWLVTGELQDNKKIQIITQPTFAQCMTYHARQVTTAHHKQCKLIKSIHSFSPYLGLSSGRHMYKAHECQNNWDLNKLAILLQIFPNSCLKYFCCIFTLNYSQKCYWINIVSGNGLVRNHRQAITWSSGSQINRHLYGPPQSQLLVNASNFTGRVAAQSRDHFNKGNIKSI